MIANPQQEPFFSSSRFEDAIRYFRERGEVVFINDSVHFWERHAFVQQSLAKLLTDNGIPVTWFDHFGWRSYKPVFWWSSPLLQVKSVLRFPGDRFSFIKKWNDKRVASVLLRSRGHKIKKPVVWVQASLSESVVQYLPAIDVFSVFDDPYRHAIGEALLEKARVVTCQNRFTYGRLNERYKEKTLLLFPPFSVQVAPTSIRDVWKLPRHFPKKVMGYLGSFPYAGTDFGIIEYILKYATEWGIVLVGRTDETGMQFVNKFKDHPRFAYFDWVPPNELAGFWKSIDVSFLPYRECLVNDGAFPVKVLESLAYGVPVVATQVPKTSSLEGLIPCERFPDKFLAAVEAQFKNGRSKTEELYRYFAERMDPKFHLLQVAEKLMEQEDQVS